MKEIKINLPKNVTSPKVVKIHVNVGDEVEKGTPLLETEGGKNNIVLKSNTNGCIQEILVQQGDTVSTEHAEVTR